jgi:N-methylhydantoinase A
LVGLGGAGPLHANALSILLGSWPSIVAPTPGVLSALGFLHSDIRNEFSRTVIRTIGQIDRATTKKYLKALGAQAQKWLASEKIAPANRRIDYQIDLRYHRQGYEFPIAIEIDWLDAEDGFDRVIDRFKAVHHQNYGFNIEHDIEVVNLRAVAVGVVAKVEIGKRRMPPRAGTPKPIAPHKIYYRGKTVSAPIYDRYALKPGDRIPGPAVITQKDSTTLILPGHHGDVDAYENILIWPNGHKKAKATRQATTSRRRAATRATRSR